MAQKKVNPKIEWGFFAVVPRVVRTQYKDLTHSDKWLYTCLKDLCGDKGTCFRTLRALKEETDISIASLSTMIPKLHEAGLIHAEKKRRSNSGKEVWHITIVDIWQSNKDFCSAIEQSKDEIVQQLNNVVQPLNKEAEVCSDIERDCSNFGYRRTTPEEEHIEERTIEEGGNPLIHLEVKRVEKRETNPRMLALSVSSHSQRLSETNEDEEDEEPTVKMPITKPQHTPGAGTRSLAATPKGDGQDDSTSDQALTLALGTPVQRSGIPPGNSPASPGAAQGGKAKSDTKEIQRRINEHRGYALEESVEIIRERKAIKSWCNLHTIEEYGLVMAGAKKDKYWGKQENYYRIGGLTLLKITPEILARMRAPLPMVANGNGYQRDMVEWQGRYMTVEEADELGFNGGFGAYL